MKRDCLAFMARSILAPVHLLINIVLLVHLTLSRAEKPTGWTILQLFIIPMELTKPYRIHSTKTLNDV